jgi:zinc D-Ala-D-Ala carboxypeptidase
MKHIYAHHTKFPMDQWRWPDFSPAEMACRGTGKLMINERSMDMLQELRNRLGKPMIVNSAYRSPEHNAAVGGAKGSYHLKAQAFDVRMDNHDPQQFMEIAQRVGFKGIGQYADKGFTHVDTREVPAHFGSKDWPKRDTRFAPEPVVKPKTDAARKGVTTTVVIAAAERVVQEAAPALPAMWITYAGVAIAVAALAAIAWPLLRRDDV